MQKNITPVIMNTMLYTGLEQRYAIFPDQAISQRQETDLLRRHLPNDLAEVTLEMYGKLAGGCTNH